MDGPLGIRDYLSYAMAGAVVMLAAVWAWHGELAFDEEISPVVVAMLLAAAYVLGHVVGHVSGRLTKFAFRWLGMPGAVVMDEHNAPPRVARMFSRYVQPLPETTRKRIVRAAELRGLDPEAADFLKALRYVALPIVRDIGPDSPRLARSGMLEDFCRNLSFAAVVGALATAIGAVVHGEVVLGFAAVVGIGCAWLFWYRSLHFKRLYYTILFTTFAERVLTTETPD